MRIRQYQKKDKEQLLKLIENCLYQIFKVKLKKIEWDISFFRKDGILYVAEDKGKIIGSIGIKQQKKEIARLEKMYVDKRYRRRGIGKKLYKKVESFAKKQGYRQIILSTTPQMKDAISFYRKNGFEFYKANKKRNQLFFRKKVR